jgi:DNA-binding MarR family transcriptional regulator
MDKKNTEKKFNFPAFIAAQLFVLQDSNLNYLDKLVFSFFYSFHVSGKSIRVSDEYLANLIVISPDSPLDKRTIRRCIKRLEDINYIKRFKNNKGLRQIVVIKTPDSNMFYDEIDENGHDTNSNDIEQLGQSDPNLRTELSYALGQNCPSHLDNKVDNKVDNCVYKKENKNPPDSNSPKKLKPIEYPDTYYENSKELKEKKEDGLIIQEMLNTNPFSFSELAIYAWFSNQKKKNKPITSGTWAMLLNDCYKYQEAGLNPQEEFEVMVKMGWDCLNLRKALKHKQDTKGSDNNSTGYLNSGILNRGGQL